jgi:hypothetical protein
MSQLKGEGGDQASYLYGGPRCQALPHFSCSAIKQRKGIGSSTQERTSELIEDVLEEGKALDTVARMFLTGRFELLSTKNAEESRLSRCHNSSRPEKLGAKQGAKPLSTHHHC